MKLLVEDKFLQLIVSKIFTQKKVDIFLVYDKSQEVLRGAIQLWNTVFQI